MCGIAGYYGKGGEAVLARMNAVLGHRGPDDCGLKVFGRNADTPIDSVGLAHCRLSIIDLSSAGHQPMCNEGGTVWVVLNGEIYNFEELRSGLRQRHSFRGRSDTEVIVHLYEEMGTGIFEKIQGMFALAIYDSNKGEVILARDRMGKKPLYWSVQGGTLVFASELKALIEHPLFRRDVDLQSVNLYLLYENVPTPRSIFKNTWKLEPGTLLRWNGSEARMEVFWRPTFLPKARCFDESLERLDSALKASVSDRLMGDVPVGIFLSGGLDSSTVAYYASKACPERIQTFSMGFREAAFDESEHARRVAGCLGTEHHEEILSVKDCLELIPKIARLLDEPMADASIIPTYLLSKFARGHVAVALGGDGGDELFFGYDTFLAHRVAGVYEKLPRFIRDDLIRKLVVNLPTSYSDMSLDFRAKRFVSGFEGNPMYRDRNWFAPFGRNERLKLFLPDVWQTVEGENEYEQIDRYLEGTDSDEMYDQLGLLYERMYLMDQVLVKVDRASMMNSLEVRAPFLDTRVVDLANHLPTSFKFRGLERKYILKKLMRGKLPDEIINRKKKGFGMPVGEWIRGDLKPIVLEVLAERSVREMGLFSTEPIEELVDEHISGKKDNRKQIWTLLIFALWWRQWMN